MRAARIMEPKLLEGEHLRQVAEWCLSYWKEWKEAPGEHIEDIYSSWSEDNDSPELVKAVHDFLDGLGKEYERADEQNIPFLLDELGELMRARRLRRVKEDLEYSLSKGEAKEAEQTLLEYRAVETDEDVGGDPMRSKEWDEVWADPLQPVIELEGDAGTFFNHALTRDSLVAIQANEKRGKTFWLIELAMRALRNRKRVAVFQCGDLSKRQFYRRLGVRWSSRPLWANQTGKIFIPNEIVLENQADIPEEDEDGEEKPKRRKKGKTGYRVEGAYMSIKDTIDRQSVKKGIARFRRACGLAPRKTYLRTSFHSTSSINVAGIDAVLDRWLAEDDFVPDLILVDYADILAAEPSNRRHEHDRNVVNDTWKALRKLSQDWHALVVTATQAKVKAVKQDLQTEESFSEDKRKLAHITAMVGINQTPEEKRMGGLRLNWIAVREAPYDMTVPLFVGSCYALCRALCVAKLGGHSR